MPTRLPDSGSVSLSRQEILVLSQRLDMSPRQLRQVLAEVQETVRSQARPEPAAPDKPWDWWKGNYRPLK